MHSSPFLSQFRALVETLRAHPNVRVFSVSVAPPVDEAAIEAAAQKWGAIEDDILSFYRACNGLHLAWMPLSHPSFDPEIHKPQDERWTSDLYSKPYPVPGQVEFPPFEEVFGLQPSSMSLEDADGYVYTEGELPHLRVFEYADTGTCAALAFWSPEQEESALPHAKGLSAPSVLIGSDHWADFSYCYGVSFAFYLELVLRTFGHNFRYFALQVMGQWGIDAIGKIPPLANAPEHWTNFSELDLGSPPIDQVPPAWKAWMRDVYFAPKR